MLKLASIKELYEDYVQHMQKIADVQNARAVLEWDQETYLPKKGQGFRARQIATLSETSYLLSTDEKLGNLLRDLSDAGSLDARQQKNISLNLEDFNKQKKYNSVFVRRMSETVSKSFNAWMEARKANSFSLFEKDLDELITLKKEEINILGYIGHPYNALLNEFEKGCTVALLDKTFNGIRPDLKNLLDRILNAPVIKDDFIYQYYPRQQQWDFGIYILEQLGFDFEAGRQDISEHPFSVGFNRNDVRITTRINENDFTGMTWSCIHEAGHALYEQGLPEDQYGLPSGEFASLGIHESQSRLWENHVGRSSGFWKFHFPVLKEIFKEPLQHVSEKIFYKAINKVKPSLIRTEADELTYHFHVMIRYEIEKMLMAGDLKTADIPACWNEHYLKYLAVPVPDDKQGCLQDVHWSHGSFGYFPTYSLGSFYAAQFFEAAEKRHPDLSKSIEEGDTSSLLDWLRQHVYRFGRTYTSEELCEKATGEPLNVSHFLNYLFAKYEKLYQL